jgi:hypothetical protein
MKKARSTSFKPIVIRIVSFAVAIFLLMFLRGFPEFIEQFYTRGFYRAVCFLLHPLLNLFPFSVGDILYTGIVLFLFYGLVKIIRLLINKKLREVAILSLRLVAAIEIAVILFYLLWGMNYFRPAAAKILSLQDTAYTVTDLTAVTAMLVDSVNHCRTALRKQDLTTDNQKVFAVAKQAVLSLGDSSADFKITAPDIKPSLLTPLLNYIGTSGYYNPFTSEAQLNYAMPVFLRPFVACHEMAHQMGFAGEDEANFTGFLAGIRSGSLLLRYSAYYLGMEEFMMALHHRDSLAFKRLKTDIIPLVKKDLKTERSYWLSYEGKISIITSIFYDNFLKANNQPKGLKTYNQMIRLAMAYYGTHGIAYKTTPSVVKIKSP